MRWSQYRGSWTVLASAGTEPAKPRNISTAEALIWRAVDLEEPDVIAVGDLHDEVTALAGLALPLVRADRLHKDVRAVGPNAERGRQRLVAHPRDDGRVRRAADVLDPASHPVSSVRTSFSFLAEKRRAAVELVDTDVGTE
jgi:hypothetical protein